MRTGLAVSVPWARRPPSIGRVPSPLSIIEVRPRVVSFPGLTISVSAFGSRGGNRTPKTINSLAAIAGHEGDEEPWNIDNYSVQDDDVCALIFGSTTTVNISMKIASCHRTAAPLGSSVHRLSFVAFYKYYSRTLSTPRWLWSPPTRVADVWCCYGQLS